MGAIGLEYFEGNMDGQKYVSILESNINKEMLQKKDIIDLNLNVLYR